VLQELSKIRDRHPGRACIALGLIRPSSPGDPFPEIFQDRFLHVNPKRLEAHGLLLFFCNPLADPKVS